MNGENKTKDARFIVILIILMSVLGFTIYLFF
jgi:hypothetical protein